MTRMTRAKAAEVAESLHVDTDDVLMAGDENTSNGIKTNPSESSSPRKPLGELAPNSSDGSAILEETTQELRKSTRGRQGGKKGLAAKNNKINPTPETTTDGVDIFEDETAVTTQEVDSTSSSVEQETAGGLSKEIAQLDISQDRDTRSKTPPSATSRVTRGQAAKNQETEVIPEPKSLIDGIGQTPEEQREDAEFSKLTEEQPQIFVDDQSEVVDTMEKTALDAPASPLPSAVPNVVASLRKDSPAKRSTSNKENVEPPQSPIASAIASPAIQHSPYDALEYAAVQSASPPRAVAESPSSRPEDNITALDDLSDALESAKKDIPDVPTSPEKASNKGLSEKLDAVAKKDTKKNGPVVRTTKASQARLSMVQGGARAPSLGKPRPSIGLGRSTSVRSAPKANEAAAKRIPSITEDAKTSKSSETAVEKKEVVIPHSKPRPISMSFPTPPPVAKSTRAPTQSIFKLPGEAIAEKLKAQREARQAREAEEEAKKRTFKARPVPASLRGAAPAVRSTNASKARESAIGIAAASSLSSSVMKDSRLGSSTTTRPPMVAPAHKRANSVTTAARPRPRLASNTSSFSASTTANKPGSITSRPASMALASRPSTAMANLSKPGNAPLHFSSSSTASTSRPTTSSTSAAVPKVGGTTKGREVFNRAAVAKEAAEREKREKEAAAKQARVAAAERGRAASREWAEKQRLRKLGLSGKVESSGAEKAAAEVEVKEVVEEPVQQEIGV